MNTLRNALVAVLILFAWNTARADFRVSVGTDDFYFSVGKYDYYPYGVPYNYRPRISFYDVMSDYGTWVYVPSFGRVWHPYADYRWRPYLYGHWTYTQYGPTWQGYEPWAWVGYHYGNWIWTANLGWVWVPGYDWHPGRVVWSYGPTAVGWTPAPPPGYDYCGGTIHYHGGYNQYTYNDPDYGYDGYYRYDNRYGRYDRYDSRYGQLYGSPSYTNISVNLWVFINRDHYGRDNYADCRLDGNYTRDLFTKRAVRISSAPVQRTQFERIVKQRITEVPVDVREIETERKSVKLVIPRGEEEHIRKNANRVVRDVIAPAYEKEHRNFNGNDSRNEKAVERIFKQAPSARQPEVKHIEKTDTRRSDNDASDRNRLLGPPVRIESSRSSRSTTFEDREQNREQTRDGYYRESKSVEPVRKNTDDRYRPLGPPQRVETTRQEPDRQFDARNRQVEPVRKDTDDRYRPLGPPQRVETTRQEPGRQFDARNRQFEGGTGKDEAIRVERDTDRSRDRVDRGNDDSGKATDLKKEQDNDRDKKKDSDKERKSRKEKDAKESSKRARDKNN